MIDQTPLKRLLFAVSTIKRRSRGRGSPLDGVDCDSTALEGRFTDQTSLLRRGSGFDRLNRQSVHFNKDCNRPPGAPSFNGAWFVEEPRRCYHGKACRGFHPSTTPSPGKLDPRTQSDRPRPGARWLDDLPVRSQHPRGIRRLTAPASRPGRRRGARRARRSSRPTLGTRGQPDTRRKEESG